MRLKDDTRLIISLGFCAILVLMSLIIYIALRQLQSQNFSMSNVVEETNVKMETANSMRDAIRQRANSLKTMALSSDIFDRDDEYLRFLDHARIYREAREKLLTRKISAEEDKILVELSRATQIAQPSNELAAVMLMSNVDKEKITEAVADAVAQQDKLLILLDKLVEYERVSAKQALQSANTDYSRSRSLMFLLAGAALILSFAIATLVIRGAASKNRRIYYQANHDDLTGLLNRRAFENECNQIFETQDIDESESALLYLDLDQFKIINDTCGHAAGDQLLCRLTKKLSQRLRQTDIFARLGGDEFGVLLKNCSLKDATVVAETLRKTAENYDFAWDTKKFLVGVSIGVVPVSKNRGSMAKILSTADMACLEAKHAGRNRIRVAEIDDKQINKLRGDMDTVSDIKQALEDNRFTLYYQSVISTDESGQSDHIEVLVRMIYLDGHIVQPGGFIPVAERYNLMSAIDKWVIRNVMLWLQEWQSEQPPPKVMINLSGQSVCDESFLQYIIEVFDEADIDFSSICFEITETAAISNLDEAVSFINALKGRGCEFALDDFGSGLSSFAYLKKLPVDYLKIDGAFVKEIEHEPIDCAMVRSINEIGHVMMKKTIAEFVENEAILTILKEIGVDYAQGYGIAKPRPLSEFTTNVAGVSTKKQSGLS